MKKKYKPPRRQSGFYGSDAWLALRFQVLREQGRKCVLCNRTEAVFHVDHIKPRSIYPELSLDKSNLQVLCRECNLGKRADDNDANDFRSPIQKVRGLLNPKKFKTRKLRKLAKERRRPTNPSTRADLVDVMIHKSYSGEPPVVRPVKTEPTLDSMVTILKKKGKWKD